MTFLDWYDRGNSSPFWKEMLTEVDVGLGYNSLFSLPVAIPLCSNTLGIIFIHISNATVMYNYYPLQHKHCPLILLRCQVKTWRKESSHFNMYNQFISFLFQLRLTGLYLVVTFITKSILNVINWRATCPGSMPSPILRTCKSFDITLSLHHVLDKILRFLNL